MHDNIVRVWAYNAGYKADPGFVLDYLLVQGSADPLLQSSHFR